MEWILLGIVIILLIVPQFFMAKLSARKRFYLKLIVAPLFILWLYFEAGISFYTGVIAVLVLIGLYASYRQTIIAK